MSRLRHAFDPFRRVTRVAAAVVLAATVLATTAVAADAKARLVCGARAPGMARCHAVLVLDSHGAPAVHRQATGLTPGDLQQAYQLPSDIAGDGQVVGVIDAYGAPTLVGDLAAYRSAFGLPPCDAGCLRIVDQRGGSSLPRANAGWAGETSLDVDMVSATCPHCGILVVQADSSSLADLAASQDTAVALGATVLTDSFGGAESAGETEADAHFHHPGIATVVSSGDDGFGTGYPAASPFVIAVGGTSLRPATTSRGWSESAWTGSGSGCSPLEPRPSWQVRAGCDGRAIADVAAVADPATGVAVYDSYPMGGRRGGWLTFGGTSAAAPIVAGAIALAGNGASFADGAGPAYAAPGAFNDVRRGRTGSCSPAWLCTAGNGVDGPTGLGSPAGTGGL